MPKKDYVERNITLVGRTRDTDDDKACGVCQDADELISSAVKYDNRIKYNKIEVDTPEGQQIAEDRNIDGLPYIKDCKVFEKGGKPRCKEMIGYEPDEDFSDLSELVEKNTNTNAKQEESTSKTVDSESGVQEPSEPVEPESEQQ